MNSCLYVGTLRHRRHTPVPHAFRYRLFMCCIDLAELDVVFANRWLWSTKRPALAWLRRSDYLGDPTVPLDLEVRALVERETGQRPRGPVRLLTHLRMFGHGFNPVSFYYCYDQSGSKIDAIVAEITNTPWGERHAYVLSPNEHAAAGDRLHFQFDKCFHVSPFMPMDMAYDWRFTVPGEHLAVFMKNQQADKRVFDATLNLERRAMSGANLALALLRFPWLTVQVVIAIYWQAMRLWFKRVPRFDHPSPGT